MHDIHFQNERYAAREGESVLDCLLRNGFAMPHSCKSGVCQSCIMRAVSGTIPAKAQTGLRDTLRAQGYVLACCFVPEGDVEIALIDTALLRTPGSIESIDPLNATVVRVRVRTEKPIEYRPGQYVNLVRADGLVRSYSLASVPEEDELLELHVAAVPGGRMSGWMHRRDGLGAQVALLGPVGNCFYVPGNAHQPIFLAGTNTGLAPLYGIVRDALRRGHEGPIHLFHGAIRPEGLYLADELRAMASRNANVHYYASVLQGEADGVATVPLDQFSLQTVPKLSGHKVYLCGHPDFVRIMQRKTFLAGASLSDIYADAFVPSPE
ncbi:MAG: 2Fe-2S iron-sulfur cluster binding domain-containing protein [Candidatus Hydrogenedentes bacterium]|nr:2Fe-2S iron-sulfur cluster binding domain-containing protein [Candidatus Hydrogenedentota bacterium]